MAPAHPVCPSRTNPFSGLCETISALINAANERLKKEKDFKKAKKIVQRQPSWTTRERRKFERDLRLALDEGRANRLAQQASGL
ncbi:hypothetical protein OC861_004041 [Tilletia horrida]|nr:hypothetical protein OC861_004041 [Tilletia horrida]